MGNVDSAKATRSTNQTNKSVVINVEYSKLTMAKIVSAGQGIT